MAILTNYSGDILLGLAILLGVVSAIATYRNSLILKGEVFELPFIYFAVGMLLVTVSLATVVFLQGVLEAVMVSVIHDVSFIIGFVFMLTASVMLQRHLQRLHGVSSKLK